jgi:putative phage-type endonuclease
MTSIEKFKEFYENLPLLSEEEWLQSRQKGIGGSEIGVILGLSPWMTRLKLYEEKINPKPTKPTPSQQRGKQLEPLVIKYFTEATGFKLLSKIPYEVDDYGVISRKERLLMHPNNPIIIGTVDALFTNPEADDELILLEVKTTAEQYETGEIAKSRNDSYIAQCTYYAGILSEIVKANNWDDIRIRVYQAFLAKDTFGYFEITEWENLYPSLFDLAQTFYVNHIQAQVAPNPEYDGEKIDFYRLRYNESAGYLIPTAKDISVLTEFVYAKHQKNVISKQIKQWEKKIEELKVVLVDRLKGKVGFVLDDKPIFQIKKSASGALLFNFDKDFESRIIKDLEEIQQTQHVQESGSLGEVPY